jgi:hypothetical protein
VPFKDPANRREAAREARDHRRAAPIIFKEGAGNAAIGLQTPVLAINGTDSLDLRGGGILSAAADNVLKVDVTLNSTVTGTVWGFEE